MLACLMIKEEQGELTDVFQVDEFGGKCSESSW